MTDVGDDLPERVYHERHGIVYEIGTQDTRGYVEIEPADPESAPQTAYSGRMPRFLLNRKLASGDMREVEDGG